MFYLSFENSLCDQYVTEKLWSWLKKDIVPVVMGQADYAAMTPPHSVVNAMDFPEPRDLAAHLLNLGGNSIENFWLQFRVEKPLEFWLEIPYTKKTLKNG